jgi:nitrogen fixation protein NifB
MLKIAVASSDGVTINEHFGQSGQFWVYEVEDDGTHRQVEIREIARDGGDCSPAALAHDGIIDHLAGIDVVLAAQIGPGAVYSLRIKGIKAFAIKGPIEKALSSYGKRHKLLGLSLPGGSHNCGSGGGCAGKGCR